MMYVWDSPDHRNQSCYFTSITLSLLDSYKSCAKIILLIYLFYYHHHHQHHHHHHHHHCCCCYLLQFITPTFSYCVLFSINDVSFFYITFLFFVGLFVGLLESISLHARVFARIRLPTYKFP